MIVYVDIKFVFFLVCHSCLFSFLHMVRITGYIKLMIDLCNERWYLFLFQFDFG
jgi:hypothetical protein